MSATSADTDRDASLHEVLAALSDPVRLEMVRRLSVRSEPTACRLLYDGISKSTASHHFKTLREAGIVETRLVDGHTVQVLRSEHMEATYPGLLASIVAAARA